VLLLSASAASTSTSSCRCGGRYRGGDGEGAPGCGEEPGEPTPVLATFGEWVPSVVFGESFAGATIFRFLLLVEAVLKLIARREARKASGQTMNKGGGKQRVTRART
jgi:hypothetical protein